ncbi:MAG: D-alanyl-D-alanine carboxypeptidase [Alphaproteobacteria bacterium]|jgi:D-alanyl-D-alanine carboxypeptidase (penicillin-binding protein 5/6)|nr:D-alanyl-D-alanine carboxypeptidase [Alphaproteobacteria bacterium]
MIAPRLIAFVLALTVALPAWAAFETRGTAAYIYDVTTGTVLFETNAETPLPPASMSKLMTLNMLFEALRDGRVTLETEFQVSTKARLMGGSTMFLDETDRPTVLELIKGIIVQSGNDACIVVAEGLAGTEDAFARLMNERAADLGMTGSTFVNSSGWPDPNHRMSMRDLGILATRLITEFPEYYGYFSMAEYDFDGRSPANRFNRNPILGLGIGGDGLKTGHTQEAGYGLVGSALQGKRRVVFVVTGLDSRAARAEESERMVSWAFRQFVERSAMKGGTVVADAEVWMGDHTQISLVAPEDVTLLMPATNAEITAGRVEYRGPLEAPISKGQPVAELVVPRDGLEDARIPLVSDRDVARGGFLPRLRTAALVLFRQALGQAQSLR